MTTLERINAGGEQPVDIAFARDVIEGLSKADKHLPCRWLYDARGSELFEDITELEEYYPTRTEAAILAQRAPEIAARTPAGSILVEFGSGSSRKTEIVLAALQGLRAYVPIDVSSSALDAAAQRLAQRFPTLAVLPILGDFFVDIALPPQLAGASRLGFFPGSTIGNLTPEAAIVLLRHMGEVLRPDARLVVGVDLQKPLDRLIPAYDDASGVTAAFNLNLLARINRELGGTFDLEGFRHEAVWNAREGRVEMHLVSRRRQQAHVLDRTFGFGEGERVHTENSYKHTIEGFRALVARAGWTPLDSWTDAEALFSLHDLVYSG